MDLTITNYEQLRTELGNELKKTANSFVKIGYLLRVAKDTDTLKGHYSSVWDFAKTEYGLDKSQASRFMSINEKFSEGGYSDHLLQKYESYGSTKLTLMLNLPDNIIDELSPEMSKQDIKGIAQDYKAEQQVTPIERMMERPEVSMEDMTLLQKCLYQLAEENPQMWVDVSHAVEAVVVGVIIKDRLNKEVISIMAPDGEKMYRLRIQGEGRKVLKVTETGISLLDMRTTQKEELNTLDLVEAWEFLVGKPEIWQPETNVYDTWEALYKKDFPGRPKKKQVAPAQFDSGNPVKEGNTDAVKTGQKEETGSRNQDITGETEERTEEGINSETPESKAAGAESTGELVNGQTTEKNGTEEGHQGIEQHTERSGCTENREADSARNIGKEAAGTEDIDNTEVEETEENEKSLGKNEEQIQSKDMPEVQERTESNLQEQETETSGEGYADPVSERLERGTDDKAPGILDVEEQLPGQMDVTDYPELMPENPLPEPEDIPLPMPSPAAVEELEKPKKEPRRKEVKKAWGVGELVKEPETTEDNIERYVTSIVLLADDLVTAAEKKDIQMLRLYISQITGAVDKLEAEIEKN